MKELHKKLEQYFTVECCTDISKNVSYALELDNDRKTRFIKKQCPKILIPVINKFSGVAGSRIYEELRTGKTAYYSWLLKPIKAKPKEFMKYE